MQSNAQRRTVESFSSRTTHSPLRAEASTPNQRPSNLCNQIQLSYSLTVNLVHHGMPFPKTSVRGGPPS